MPRIPQKTDTSFSPTSTSWAPPRRGLRREDAAFYVGISPRTFDAWVSDGRLPQPRRIGGITLWDLRQLDASLDAMFSSDEGASNPWDDEP